MKFRYITPLIILSLAATGCFRIYLPSIEGTVLEGQSKKPIENAYVLCFNYKYPLSQWINLGGPNSKLHSIEYTKTNHDGLFKLGSFWALNLAQNDTRHFYIYKPGYSVLSYHQASLTTLEDLNNWPWMTEIPNRDIFLITAQIQEHDRKWYLAYEVHKYFMDYQNKFPQHLPFFLELYNKLIIDAESGLKSSNNITVNISKRILAELKGVQAYLPK